MNEYTEELKKIFKKAESETLELKNDYVSSEHYILSILTSDNYIKEVLNDYNIFYEDYKMELIREKNIAQTDNIVIYSLSFKKIIENSNSFIRDESKLITPIHIFLSILEDNNNLGVEILERLNCPMDDLYMKLKKQSNSQGRLFINEIGNNLNEKAKNNLCEKTIGREKEINRIIEILARKNKNNPILIGEAGVGKTAIVEELAKKINDGKIPLILKNTEIISISMSSLVAGTKYRGEFEEKLGKIIKELENNPNIILFIDEIHTLVGAGGAEGAIDASNILKPALARNNIKCIGATTLTEYKKFIEKDKALARRFQKVYIEETTEDETLHILKKIKKDYEKFHGVKISNEILELITSLSKRYIADRKEPDRSIDILDEVCAKASVSYKDNYYIKLLNRKQKLAETKKEYLKLEDYITASKIKKEELEIDRLIKIEKKKSTLKEVTKEDLKQVLEIKSNSIIIELSNKSQCYKKIKNNVKKEIVGQDDKIDEIIDIISRKNVDFNKTKPLSIIFNGESGIGKTATAKIIAKELKYNLIKLDMSEFNSEMSVNKIVGSSQGYIGYDEVNTIFENVKDKPNSLIILDEFDKANAKVLNVFLNIFDEGYLRNSKNEIIDFKNCIFILTTNHLNKENNIGFNKVNKTNYEKFNKEFLNRIDYFITFNSLTKENIYSIINLELQKLSKIKGLTKIEISNIIEKSNYKIAGARKIKNLIIKELSKKYIKN